MPSHGFSSACRTRGTAGSWGRSAHLPQSPHTAPWGKPSSMSVPALPSSFLCTPTALPGFCLRPSSLSLVNHPHPAPAISCVKEALCPRTRLQTSPRDTLRGCSAPKLPLLNGTQYHMWNQQYFIQRAFLQNRNRPTNVGKTNLPLPKGKGVKEKLGVWD